MESVRCTLIFVDLTIISTTALSLLWSIGLGTETGARKALVDKSKMAEINSY